MSENKLIPITAMIGDNGETLVVDGQHRLEAAKAEKKRGRPPKVQQEMFVEMWNGSTNLNEVAESLGISKLSCSVRASNLRKAGHNLRAFKRGRKKLKK